MTTLRENSSIQMQCLAQIRAFQHAAKPANLVRRLEKRVIAVDGGVLTLDDILDLADRLGRDIPDSLDMLWNKHEVSGIDVPGFDEASGLLRAPAGVVLVHQAALVVHEAVEIAAGAGQALAEVVGGHFQNFTTDRVADAENLPKREDQSLFSV